MPKADTGNFNRFLTSIGLLLLAAALLIPYFYFRDNDTLRIPQVELRKLTPTAKAALERRQQRSADLEVPVLVFSALLIGSGVTALFFGGKRLRLAQTKEDEAIERQARREDYEFQQMSAAEVEVRRDEQAREAVLESQEVESKHGASEGSDSSPVSKPGIPAPDQPESSAPQGLVDVQFGQAREEIARIEEKTKQALDRLGPNPFEYLSEMQIVQAGGKRRVDLDHFFKARTTDQPDIVLELKVTRRLLRTTADLAADRLLALLTRYREMTGKEAIGWLLFVLPKGAEEVPEWERAELEEIYAGRLSGHGRCSIVWEQELDELPSRFIEVFGT
jgi:hypothetical protein